MDVKKKTGIREHAILYALICRELISFYGKEKGEELIEKITNAYGMKRGSRMRDNSVNGDLNDYFINGEWKGEKAENISDTVYEKEKTITTVHKCAWFDSWKENGLLEYGRYYCRYIDKAICRGYDEDLKLDVEESLGCGDERCIFIWHQGADENRVLNSERKHILDFDHHCRELFSCMKEELEEDDRDRIAGRVEEEFEGYGGKLR